MSVINGICLIIWITGISCVIFCGIVLTDSLSYTYKRIGRGLIAIGITAILITAAIAMAM